MGTWSQGHLKFGGLWCWGQGGTIPGWSLSSMACTGWMLLIFSCISVYCSIVLKSVNVGEFEWLCQTATFIYSCTHRSNYTHTPRKLVQAIRSGLYLGDAQFRSQLSTNSPDWGIFISFLFLQPQSALLQALLITCKLKKLITSLDHFHITANCMLINQ